MAIEYEEEFPSGEPEHPHRQILDRFFCKIADRDLSGAAKELRTLHDKGGSLCRSDLELLADLLDASSALGTAFPYRLGCVKRSRAGARASKPAPGTLECVCHWRLRCSFGGAAEARHSWRT
jgi:hypothetical protein